MREQFLNFLIKKAEKDKNIILITGDLGYSILEPFAKKYPDQFINVGCIEQTMIGLACGLSKQGFKPYVYSGSTFLLFRPYEFVRNDVAYGNNNVKLIGYTGKKDNFLGHTHNIINQEDINLLLSLPNINQYIPENDEQLEEMLEEAYRNNKPAYIRLDKPKVYSKKEIQSLDRQANNM